MVIVPEMVWPDDPSGCSWRCCFRRSAGGWDFGEHFGDFVSFFARRHEFQKPLEDFPSAGKIFFVLVEHHAFAPQRHGKVRCARKRFFKSHQRAVAMAGLHENKAHVAMRFGMARIGG